MKRANGKGTVEVLPDGRARIRAPIDGKRRQLGPIWPTEEKAQAMLDAWNAEQEDGAIVETTRVTLASYGADWLDRREVGGSDRRERVRSISGERSVWSRHVAPSELASMPLASVRPRDVQAFARELRTRKAQHAITKGRGADKRVEIVETSRPLSRAMQREAMRLVRAVMDDAVRADILERNPADGIGAARGSTSPRDLSEDWLRWPEVLRLVSCEAINARDRRAYACAIGLALRLDDLKSIEVARIELDCEVPGPGISVWIAKSQRWHRVPIMPWLAPVIREQLASLSSAARFLFPTREGKRYAKDFDFGWAEDRERRKDELVRHPSALERAGVERRIRFHDLRGTCATHLALGTWGRTWSLHEIQAMLAHSDQRVTERYVRRAIDMLSEAAKATPGCPGLPMGATGAAGDSSFVSRAPGPGLEPGTIRLTAGGTSESSREVTPTHGQPPGNVAMVALAEDVVRLAAADDPHAMRRALELAEAVVVAFRSAVTEPQRASGSATKTR